MNRPVKRNTRSFTCFTGQHTEETWTRVGRANIILDNLIALGKAKPMIVVMPYGRAFPIIGKGSGSLRNWDNLQEFQKDFLGCILPSAENNYRIRTDRESRAIAGFFRRRRHLAVHRAG
jgi:enterochelin esterase-like enzyme